MKQIKKLLLATGLCLLHGAALQAQFSLSGTVKSETGEPVPFVIVALKNTQLARVTAVDGSFYFDELPRGTYIMLVRGFGYVDETDTVFVEQDTRYNATIKSGSKQLDEVVVGANRVDKNSGMAFSNLDAETIKKQNLGQDAPFILGQLPSVVVNSDAGNGVGYTGLRIRGSDGTRINVTINGVPVNDAESQGTFFVNMPDFLSGVNSIQVQRGVGASSNGAGAFGATINFQTNQLNEKPYASAVSTFGSFRTFRNTLAAGTGLLNGRFTLDARASRITSNGYIDRASSNLQSYYLAAGYYGKKSVLKFINFLGQEKTYQAWYYVPEDSLKRGNRTYNPAGEYYDANGVVKYYPNETDNYKQNNFQLHFIHRFNSRLGLNVTAHYTKGAGYYEQYKAAAGLSSYQINNVVTPSGDVISKSDLICRLWLDNDFAGGIFNLHYSASPRLSLVFGGGYNTYFGKHFGRVVWSRYASNSEINHQYYFNVANKNDGNFYVKANYKPMQKLNIFGDMQVRYVNYRFVGFNDFQQQKLQDVTYVFYNPKIGLSYDINSKYNCYASFSMANKEPNRSDFVDSSPGSRPEHEQLADLETGIKYESRKLNAGINFYNMHYTNQLVLNGKINDVGAYTRVNVARSFRRGLELEFSTVLSKHFSLGANAAFSVSKIEKFTEYTDSSDADYTIFTQYKKEFSNTDISFSPAMVTSANLVYKPVKGLELCLIQKYVSRQYLDNTGNRQRSINPYQVFDFRLNYSVKTKLVPELQLMLGVYNLLSTNYETNGYTFSYYEGSRLNTFNYLAPAAPVNFLGGVSLKF